MGIRRHWGLPLPNGRLLAVGGEDSSGNAVDTIQEYEVDSQVWTLRSETLPVAKAGPSVMVPADWCQALA